MSLQHRAYKKQVSGLDKNNVVSRTFVIKTDIRALALSALYDSWKQFDPYADTISGFCDYCRVVIPGSEIIPLETIYAYDQDYDNG